MNLDYFEKKYVRWPTDDDLSTVQAAEVSFDNAATWHPATVQADQIILRNAKIGTKAAIEILVRGPGAPTDATAITISVSCGPRVRLTGPAGVEVLVIGGGKINLVNAP